MGSPSGTESGCICPTPNSVDSWAYLCVEDADAPCGGVAPIAAHSLRGIRRTNSEGSTCPREPDPSAPRIDCVALASHYGIVTTSLDGAPADQIAGAAVRLVHGGRTRGVPSRGRAVADPPRCDTSEPRAPSTTATACHGRSSIRTSCWPTSSPPGAGPCPGGLDRGRGRAPRAWSLAFLLFAEGAKNLARIDLVISGYRDHIDLEPEEVDRLPALMRARPTTLAVWSFCHGRLTVAETLAQADAVITLAKAAGARARAAWAAARRS